MSRYFTIVLKWKWYQEQFQEQLEGQTWQIATQNIYVAPEGVAAGVTLTAEQAPWYMMSEEAAPHVSLALERYIDFSGIFL